MRETGPLPGSRAYTFLVRVLLVDDAPVVRRVVATALRAHGVVLVEAESVSEALAHVDGEAATFDAAVLDLELLDGDGVAVAEALAPGPASGTRARALRIAFFSGTEDDELRARAEAHGRVFRKPADLAELVSWVLASA